MPRREGFITAATFVVGAEEGEVGEADILGPEAEKADINADEGAGDERDAEEGWHIIDTEKDAVKESGKSEKLRAEKWD